MSFSSSSSLFSVGGEGGGAGVRNRRRPSRHRNRDDEQESGIELRADMVDEALLFDVEQAPAEDSIKDPMQQESLSEDLEDPLKRSP